MTRHLPSGWTERTVSQLCSLITSGSRGWAKYYADTGAGFIRVQNIRRGRIDLDLDDLQRVRPPSNAEGSRTRLNAHDITITITADLGRVGLVDDAVGEAYVNQHVALARPTSCVEPTYLAWFITGPDAQEQLGLLDRGATRSGLGLKDIQGLNVPLPPLAEQRRIVARIEALFARTRRARVDLERIAPLSTAFRQRSLKQTFADAADASKLVPLGSLLTAIEAGKNMRCDERRPRAGERGIVKISAVTWGRFDPDAIKTAPADAALDPRSRIADGEFLMSRANTLELVGAPVIATDVPPDTFLSDKVLRLRFRDAVDRWVLWFLRSSVGRQEIEARSSGNQLSMRNIGQGALREIPIPLPDAASRTKALDAIERGEERTAIAEREAAHGLAFLDRLEQSVLACAFRGELVPQDTAETDDAIRPAAAAEDTPVIRRRRISSVAA